MNTDQARVVVIGGGIMGCSVAYHLALAGWTDVLLIEKHQLTSGSTCQAAGLVTAFNPSATMLSFRRYSIELYEQLGVFDRVGSLRLASSMAQLKELQRTASRARGIGLDAEVIGPSDATRLMPAISEASLFGAVHLAGDGHLDPHRATHAVAEAARRLGVRIRQGVRVTGFELSARREVRRVITDRGSIDTEVVVNAAGMWAPRLAAMVGGTIPSTPVDHQHIALKGVPGHELPRDMPCFRDPDNLVYGKAENGGMVFGGYELEPVSRWEDGVPWDHAARSLPPDYERFAPLMAGAVRRFPFLDEAEVVRLVCHPDAMTPDANPLIGPLSGVRGLWIAAGLSLNGFGGAGGIGRAMAGWITAGDPDADVGPYLASRFGDTYRDPLFAAALGRERYADYYRLRYPYDADLAGRPRRLSPLHGRLQEDGAVFETKAGWERADHYEETWRRAGRDQAAYGWTTPPWFELVVAEGRAVRERAGIIDLSSFGKVDVVGPAALSLLQRVAANEVDVAVGSVVYTAWCNEHGRMVADVTVTRLGPAHFRVVTGAGYLASDMAWLERQRADDEDVSIRDVSPDLTTIGLWGPRARDILAATTGDPTDDSALAARRARTIRVGASAAPVLATRISYAGELGWELTTPRPWAVAVWDALRSAGVEHGLRPIGYRALDGLRMEKGYRYFGTDVTMVDDPYVAGLGAFVDLDKGPFIGRDALLEAHQAHRAGGTRRLSTVLIGDDSGYLPVYGGEAVRADGEVIGRLRSVAYGPVISRTIGYVYRDAASGEDARLSVDVFDRQVPATFAADVLWDPAGRRMRG
ncbi:MAG TPA: FAD-dependent oxidoreductase [Candidatus Limnocylindrales bacterium]|jgi:4-methylaminobutanoate oxidase (formaldehyde-forming)|nr:FAD-dependent oxidoreductase [Candidatus Limnocylindrales bacterium]